MKKKHTILRSGYIAIEAVVVTALVLSIGFFGLMNFADYGQLAQSKLSSVLGLGGSLATQSITGIEYDEHGYATSLNINPADINPLTDFAFNDLGESYEITGYLNETDKDVVIPRTYSDGKPIVGIAYLAFYEKGLTSVAIPYGITSLGDCSFAINFLTEIIIPDSVTVLRAMSFYENQITSFKLPDGIKQIMMGLFRNNALVSVVIPDSVEMIDAYAFSSNKISLLEIPESVISIGDYAFSSNKITTLSILGTVRIGNGEFKDNLLETVIFKNLPDMLSSENLTLPIENSDIGPVFENNPTLTTNSIKVPVGSLATFQAYAARYGVPAEAFYE